MLKFRKYKGQEILSLFLAVIMLLQPLYGISILAQEVTPTETPPVEEILNDPPPADPTPTTVAVATETTDTNITNNDQADVNNNVDANANTGGNSIVEPTPTPIQEENVESVTPTDEPTSTPSVDPGSELSPTPTLDVLGEGGSSPETSSESISPTPTLESLGEGESGVIVSPGTTAENDSTEDNSNNSADSSSNTNVEVTNNNDANVTNFSEAAANTGINAAEGKDSSVTTENASASIDVVNFVNTNLVGAEFWQLVVNMFANNNNDIDLTQIEGYQNFDPALLSVLAKNGDTGDGSVNIALANILSSYSVLNNNNAQLTNNATASANTGDNQIDGKRSDITTGDATASTNVFNLVNTNLVGSDWFFGIINLFKQQNGDIILPYELQYLLGEDESNFENATAINQNTGDGSQNIAQSSLSSSTLITNNNNADINNNISATSNSGNNTIVGKDSSITTGNAQSMINLMNVINTNIYGSHWLLLAVNNYGTWNGDILGWWGNKITIGNTTYIWIKLPDDTAMSLGSAEAVNCNTGDGSQNQAVATSTNSLEVVNNNSATVENNVTVSANTGGNTINGKRSEITTGNAAASANVANVVNTNIIGNNWFFGVINIFGGFMGNIIFPRPDLGINKSADRATANQGDQITYTISYQNTGRVWAKNVTIDDQLPAGVVFVSAGNGGALQGNQVVWKLDKIDSGSSGSLTLVVRVDSSMSAGSTLSNCALISTTTNEPNKGNNQSCVSTYIGGLTEPTATPPPSGNGNNEGNGGAGATSSGSTGGSGGSVCTPPNAPVAPRLLSAIVVSPTEVKLTWEKVANANQYLISYGTESGKYVYGNPNVGDTDSYVVGSLNEGERYFFVVAAGIGGGCTVAGPYSNELSSTTLSFGGILGVQQVNAQENFNQGEINGGISTESGEVAGTASKGTCPIWWIALMGQTIVIGGFYGFALGRGKSPKYWWVVAPALIGVAYLVDHYAHTHWFDPSKECPFEPLFGAGLGIVETIGFKFLKKA